MTEVPAPEFKIEQIKHDLPKYTDSRALAIAHICCYRIHVCNKCGKNKIVHALFKMASPAADTVITTTATATITDPNCDKIAIIGAPDPKKPVATATTAILARASKQIATRSP